MSRARALLLSAVLASALVAILAARRALEDRQPVDPFGDSRPAPRALRSARDGPDLSVEEIVRRSLPGVVAIDARRPDGSRAQGTGFVAGEGVVATCLHVVRGASSVDVVLHDGRRIAPEEIIGPDETRDLVLLCVPPRELPILPLREEPEAEQGEPVVVIGHPLGLQQTVSDGLVSAVRRLGAGQTIIQTSAPISPGNSGGPMLDRKGRVLGVVSFKSIALGAEGLSFVVPAKYVAALERGRARVPADDFFAREARRERDDVVAADSPSDRRVGDSVPLRARAVAGLWKWPGYATRYVLLEADAGATLRGLVVDLAEPVNPRRKLEPRVVARTPLEFRLMSEGGWRGEFTAPWSCDSSTIERSSDGTFRPRGVANECRLPYVMTLRSVSATTLVARVEGLDVPVLGDESYDEACSTCGEDLPTLEEDLALERIVDPRLR